ncbi:MBOAT family O-acyltransferase [Pedosphaera parvula]|uniref:Membrane bound O-acyl transferase MBOAT family protein n=1 Tax=Pedosphaera parvula (strain Ellin514) TaxID=320771 RepID=B9XM54_PEDPL|nr:MBOAT family protein [Pedosphaera parvula]EEF59047.1 membrane bound O-acyl transferase MBOAT family protein [Pedosphaera parvula Ellin514]
MVFSSPIFLFLFLPIVLTLYSVLPGLRARNLWLLVVSVVFYAWGEVDFVFLMLGSTFMNYLLGLWVDHEIELVRRKWAVGLAVAINIGLLAFFKYANFFVSNLNSLLGVLHVGFVHLATVRLPIGISFFTFHALSYVIDIYRQKSKAARNPADVAFYIFFFPQLIAGPILRWSAIAPQIARRFVTRAGLTEGIRRFIWGLAKKMLLANSLAGPADQIFALPADGLSPALAWTGALCYTLQIYFDFSGYSDMAIGLGKMFGFEFIENFNYPYTATSIKDFWHRWHISLSTWFRDYLYFPLGGNRCSPARTGLNLVIVFFLCGLWHGASWTFVIWGLYHGLFLVLERTSFGPLMESIPRPMRHLYTLIAVVVGWVLFRADSLSQALSFIGTMFCLHPATTSQPLLRYLTNQAIFGLNFGVILSTPFWPVLKEACVRRGQTLPNSIRPLTQSLATFAEPVLLIVTLLLAASCLAAGTYNPFIYFRF